MLAGKLQSHGIKSSIKVVDCPETGDGSTQTQDKLTRCYYGDWIRVERGMIRSDFGSRDEVVSIGDYWIKPNKTTSVHPNNDLVHDKSTLRQTMRDQAHIIHQYLLGEWKWRQFVGEFSKNDDIIIVESEPFETFKDELARAECFSEFAYTAETIVTATLLPEDAPPIFNTMALSECQDDLESLVRCVACALIHRGFGKDVLTILAKLHPVAQHSPSLDPDDLDDHMDTIYRALIEA